MSFIYNWKHVSVCVCVYSDHMGHLPARFFSCSPLIALFVQQQNCCIFSEYTLYLFTQLSHDEQFSMLVCDLCVGADNSWHIQTSKESENGQIESSPPFVAKTSDGKPGQLDPCVSRICAVLHIYVFVVNKHWERMVGFYACGTISGRKVCNIMQEVRCDFLRSFVRSVWKSSSVHLVFPI